MPYGSNGKRSSSRSNVLLLAVLDLPDRSQQVILRNLSGDGALVEGAGMVEEGCEIIFRRNKLWVVANVVWVRDAHAGIRFARSLNVVEMLRKISKPKALQPRNFRRAGLVCRPLTAVERQMVENWLSMRD